MAENAHRSTAPGILTLSAPGIFFQSLQNGYFDCNFQNFFLFIDLNVTRNLPTLTHTHKMIALLVVQSGCVQFRCLFVVQSGQQAFQFSDCLAGIETLKRIKFRSRESGAQKKSTTNLRTRFGAVHDGVATIHAEWISQFVQTFGGLFVTRIDDPAVRLKGWFVQCWLRIRRGGNNTYLHQNSWP